MTKEELIKKLDAINGKHLTGRLYDAENGHLEADELLLEYINDEGVNNAFDNVEKWYA